MLARADVVLFFVRKGERSEPSLLFVMRYTPTTYSESAPPARSSWARDNPFPQIIQRQYIDNDLPKYCFWMIFVVYSVQKSLVCA